MFVSTAFWLCKNFDERKILTLDFIILFLGCGGCGYIFAISAYHNLSYKFEPCSGEMYSMLHYMIKSVSDLRQVGGFLRVLFPPPIKLTTTI